VLSVFDAFRDVTLGTTLFRLLIAILCGMAVGLERSYKNRPAGFRTHILIIVGATTASLTGHYVYLVMSLPTDMSRLGAQVITGLGFIGAGTIIVTGAKTVKGLTTAAGLWATACIGLGIGIGFYWAVLVAFAAVLITFTALGHLEARSRSQQRGAYYIELTSISSARSFCEDMDDWMSEMDVVPAKSGIDQHIGLEVIAGTPEKNRWYAVTVSTIWAWSGTSRRRKT
jgi:putative Mg2+ transporter-C (MgtC) family protein